VLLYMRCNLKSCKTWLKASTPVEETPFLNYNV
jgi:hypothetical protein